MAISEPSLKQESTSTFVDLEHVGPGTPAGTRKDDRVVAWPPAREMPLAQLRRKRRHQLHSARPFRSWWA